MILYINTADTKKIILALIDSKGEFLIKKSIRAEYKQSEKLLVGIEKIIKDKKKKIKDISGIIVTKGPGSFTALRIGITTANTLVFALGVPVVGIMDDEKVEKGLLELKKRRKRASVVPEYGMEPNIMIGSKIS